MKSLTIALVPLCAGLLSAQDRPQTQTQTEIKQTQTTVTVGPAEARNAAFDVRYHDDKGKLVVSEKSVNFEDISDSKHSRSWTYAQIKELKRDGNEIKIE